MSRNWSSPGLRSYDPDESAVFFRVREQHGVLANMAGGFPLDLAGIRVGSTEAYYQSMRWSHRPDIQARILAETSPMQAKRTAYEYLPDARPDWQKINISVMRIALRAKLIFHRGRMLDALDATGDLPIVEKSSRDAFWGATLRPDGTLKGANVLGRLWMELRNELRQDPAAYADGIGHITIPRHTLLGQEIKVILPCVEPKPEADSPSAQIQMNF